MLEIGQPFATPVLPRGVLRTPGVRWLLLMLGLLLAPGLPALSQQSPANDDGPSYTLGTNDQILIRVPQVKEIDNRPFRIDGSGNINLPRIGEIHAAGMSLQELEADLVSRLRASIGESRVSVTVVQFRSPPVFFVGLFVKPGIYPLRGNRTLAEMLTEVGGLRPNASRRITVTRREEYGPIPLANVVVNSKEKVSSAEISVAGLSEIVNPADNIVLQPYDAILVGVAVNLP
jgi:polysaccharide biosynthesis/export protein